MAPCGGLMTALNSLMPNMPKFDTLHDPSREACQCLTCVGGAHRKAKHQPDGAALELFGLQFPLASSRRQLLKEGKK
jgi:hypothetical protein